MKTKNLFLSMLAVAGMLFATSCSKEDVVNESSSEFVNATFTIGTADGIGTRAVIGKGLMADVVVCAVYDATGVEMTNLRQTVSVDLTATPLTAEYSVRLAKGQNYRVAFFAYNSTSNAYDVSDLTSIKINPNQFSNVEGRDAFTNYIDIKAEDLTNKSNIEESVTLYRPFAQLNLGIDDTELTDAANAGVIVAESEITVNQVYNAFSAYDNDVADDAVLGSMTFKMNSIPTEKLVVNGNEYTYLALNYLLVGDKGQEKSLTDVEFVWETANGKTNNPTTHFINIPVQRNYRTNILGKLLTTPTQYNITIDADFETTNGYIVDVTTSITKEVTTVADLQDAINNAPEGRTYIKLGANIMDNDNIVVNQKKDVEILIDGQGNQFYGSFTVNGGSVWGGTEGLTLQNIKFKGLVSNYVVVGENVSGNTSRYAHNVTIKDCNFIPFLSGSGLTADMVAVRAYQANDVTIINCRAEDLHSFAQITGGHNVKIDGITSTCVRGISLGSATNCFVANSNITATGSDKYGIRHNADSGADVLTLTNVNVDAFIPVVVRNTNTTPVTDYKLVFEGVNTLTKKNGSEYEVAIAKQEYDAVGKALTVLPNVTVTGANAAWSIFK